MATQQPTYQAYTVVKREGQDDFWLNIGAAFMHQDGDGYNVVLQALPDQRQNRPAPAESGREETTRTAGSGSHPRAKTIGAKAPAATNNSSLNFAARHPSYAANSSPATHVCGAFFPSSSAYIIFKR